MSHKKHVVSAKDFAEMKMEMDFCRKYDDFSVEGDVHPEGIAIIRIAGRVLGVDASSLTSDVGRMLNFLKGPLVADLSECTFLSSIAFGFLAVLAEKRSENGQCLYLVGVNKQIQRVIKMLTMSETFVFSDTIDDALDKIFVE